jgi:hypothetical protein
MSESFDIRLRKVLTCLITYKKALIQESTLQSQIPYHLNNTKELMRAQCAILTDFMRFRQRPVTNNKDLLECLDCLESTLQGFDVDLSIVCPSACESIFMASEFNTNDDVINTLIENCTPPLDGAIAEIEEQ